jgi:hypothetical protein
MDTSSTELLAKLADAAAEIAELKLKAMEHVPDAGYAIPMIMDCAEVRANHVVDQVAPWGFGTFSAHFRGLLNILHLIMNRASVVSHK